MQYNNKRVDAPPCCGHTHKALEESNGNLRAIQVTHLSPTNFVFQWSVWIEEWTHTDHSPHSHKNLLQCEDYTVHSMIAACGLDE